MSDVRIQVLDPRIVYEGRIRVGSLVITHDRLDIMEQLMDVDGYFDRVVIYDNDFAKELERLGYASRSNRGSYAGTTKLRTLIENNRERIVKALNRSSDRRP